MILCDIGKAVEDAVLLTMDEMFHLFSFIDNPYQFSEYDHCGCFESIPILYTTTEITGNVWFDFGLRTKWS